MRKVNKDPTVSIDKVSYDVPMQFISMKVEIRSLPNDLQEMMDCLDYLKDTRGIGLSTVSVMEVYRLLCAVLGLEAKGGKPGMFDAIQAQIFHLYKDKCQPLLGQPQGGRRPHD